MAEYRNKDKAFPLLDQMAINLQLILIVCIFINLHAQSAGTNSELADRLIIYVDKNSNVADSSCWTGGLEKRCNSLELALQGVHDLSASHPWVFLFPEEYTLKSSPFSKFEGPGIEDFGLVANNSVNDVNKEPLSKINCDEDAGFSFVNVEGVTLRNILLNGCGMVQPSTSRNKQTMTFWEFRVGLYLVNSSKITLESVWVTNTRGIGALLYSCYGDNRFESCQFYSNSAHRDIEYPAGGGLYIEYSSCIPVDASNCTSRAHDQYKSSSVAISNTIFELNSAKVHPDISKHDNWLLPTGFNHSSIGRGGGLSIVFEGNSTHIGVNVSNSSFKNNDAFWGGGLFVEFHDNSSNNILTLDNVTFSNNSVNTEYHGGTGGGGARLGFIFYQPSQVHDNSIFFNFCTFYNNTARFGGGVSFYTAREPNIHEPSNKLNFSTCEWSENTAWLGAAVDLTAWQANRVGYPVEVNFHHLNVYNNSLLLANWTLLGVGALYIDNLPVRFSGFCTFELNSGTALAGTGASITFSASSFVFFQSNNGRNGGAMQLTGDSYMVTEEETFVFFYSNIAEQKGGAIFVETDSKHDLILSPNCFIRYKDVVLAPEHWISNFTFFVNKANGKDNSIYVTTIAACEWPGSDSTLCWSRWKYFNESQKDNCSRQIQTDPKQFDVTSNSHTSKPLQIYPGEEVILSDSYRMIDDLGNNATQRAVYTATIKEYYNSSAPAHNNTNNSAVYATVPEYITHNTITLYGRTNNNYTVELFTIDPRVVYTTVQVELLQCPYGFEDATNNGEQNRHFKCVCNNKVTSFNGIIQCLSVNYTSRLNLLGQWAGVSTTTGQRVAGSCPYTETLTVSDLTLPSVKEYSNPGVYFCNKTNRKDTLCGKCIEGHGPSINSEVYKCVPCLSYIEYYSWLFYLGSEILPVTIFFSFLILFNVSLTTGKANAFIFFSQVITTSFGIYYASDSEYHTLRKAYRLVYGVWNLDILSVLPIFQYCLSPRLETMTIIALEYVIAFYPLILITVLYSVITMYNRGVRPIRFLFRPVYHCSTRLRNFWNPKNSFIDAIAAFILLSYSRMVLTSTKLLRYSSLFYANGSVDSVVAYYDGALPAYGAGHVVYVIIAVLVLITFVTIPPLVLILYPLRSFHFVANHTLAKCCPLGGRVEGFLNAFYGSFKDGAQEGTRDYRFFAGLYLVYRAVFALIRFAGLWQEVYLIQNVFCLVAFLTFAILKPYRRDVHNMFDACMFALLLLISLLNQYNFNLVYLDDNKISVFVFVIEYILIWVPFIVVICLLLRWMWKKYALKIAKKISLRRTHSSTVTLSHADLQPTANNIHDDNSIMKLVDERPQMYNYGSLTISPISSSDTEHSPNQSASGNSSHWSVRGSTNSRGSASS